VVTVVRATAAASSAPKGLNARAFCLKGADAHHLVPPSLKFVRHGFKGNFPRVAETGHDIRNIWRGTTVQGKQWKNPDLASYTAQFENCGPMEGLAGAPCTEKENASTTPGQMIGPRMPRMAVQQQRSGPGPFLNRNRPEIPAWPAFKCDPVLLLTGWNPRQTAGCCVEPAPASRHASPIVVESN
jgi:hypothetical protein